MLLHTIHRFIAPFLCLALLPLFSFIELILTLVLHIRRTPFNPAGKVIFITGASSGIGAELAQEYARKKAILILVARRRNELEAVAAKCLELGAHTVVVEAVDVTVEQDLKLAIRKAGDRFGCIDLLVLNAGIGMAQNVRKCSDLSFFRQITELNYLSVVSAVIYALPFVKAASRGKIVVISSILGFTSAPSASGYCASKYALKGFIDSLRMEEPSIDITMIYPGMVDTGIFDKIAGNKVGPSNTLSQVISTKEAISLIVNAVNRGTRDEVFSLEGNFMKPFAPRLLDLITTLGFQASLKRKNQ